ncbi:MAG: UXX-star (seleno)protein family 1 [Humidesulfovibrio sp.]|nr:glutaredoxin [Desulfovibrio sp.]MDO9082443.1 UXX-star (seleno)protein family 1 [Humidesulfovibrio sp.]
MSEDTTHSASGAAVRIYGKDGCPHTRRARAALPGAIFFDVLSDPQLLEEMLRLSGGVRRIPVITRGAEVEIGFLRGA